MTIIKRPSRFARSVSLRDSRRSPPPVGGHDFRATGMSRWGRRSTRKRPKKCRCIQRKHITRFAHSQETVALAWMNESVWTEMVCHQFSQPLRERQERRANRSICQVSLLKKGAAIEHFEADISPCFSPRPGDRSPAQMKCSNLDHGLCIGSGETAVTLSVDEHSSVRE